MIISFTYGMLAFDIISKTGRSIIAKDIVQLYLSVKIHFMYIIYKSRILFHKISDFPKRCLPLMQATIVIRDTTRNV